MGIYGDEEEQAKPVRKFRLRRLGTVPSINSKDDIIEKNLEPLKQHQQKKKEAQESYYRNHNSNVSPLLRGRMPVKQRLGQLPIGTSTTAVAPRLRLRRLNGTTTANNYILKRKLGHNQIQRGFSIVRTNENPTSNQQMISRRIKLRRITQAPLRTSGNLQIEVRNNNMVIQNPKVVTKRFRQILNAEIQAQIQDLQSKFTGYQLIPQFVTPATTNLTTNDRFALLSEV